MGIKLKYNVKPIVCKTRPVVYAMKNKVESEIERLEKEGLIELVETSDWATPIVPVLKSNGQGRLCGDFKITLNPFIEENKHPIPRIQDLIYDSKGIFFTKIDLSQAYMQICIEPKSRQLLKLSTYKLLYRPK